MAPRTGVEGWWTGDPYRETETLFCQREAAEVAIFLAEVSAAGLDRLAQASIGERDLYARPISDLPTSYSKRVDLEARERSKDMGLFGRKEHPPFKCYICDEEVEKRNYEDHLAELHATAITETAPSWLSPGKRAEGYRRGGFTWKCRCGVADGYWNSMAHASNSLMNHLALAHRFNGRFGFDDSLAFRIVHDLPKVGVIPPYSDEG